jgi:CRISPR-associated protein Cmr1
MKMQKIEARYEIVTPMFIGGGDKQESPEIRPPSIKGALRFWWRALQWGNCLKEKDNDADNALQLLHEQEAILFGAAYRDDKYGQGLCTLKLKDVQVKGEETSWPSNNDAGAGFLGYGLDQTKTGDPHRKGIKEGQFTVCLILKNKINNEQKKQLENTLLIWGLLGGLGSRSRRGFGSVAIQSMDEQSFRFKQPDDYYKSLRKLLNSCELAPEMPAFTALNKAMKIREANIGKDARKLMDKLGREYKEARKEAGTGLAKLPFGLPLAGNRGESDEKNRRSSPLFMHIHKIEMQCVAVVSFIPADFHYKYHPEGQQIGFYAPLQTYMDTMVEVYP